MTTKDTTKKSDRYIEAVGRRKCAIARVRITPDSKESIVINDKAVADHIKVKELQNIATEA